MLRYFSHLLLSASLSMLCIVLLPQGALSEDKRGSRNLVCAWCMWHGVWYMAPEVLARHMVHNASGSCMVHGVWCLQYVHACIAHGAWRLRCVHDSRCMASEVRSIGSPLSPLPTPCARGGSDIALERSSS